MLTAKLRWVLFTTLLLITFVVIGVIGYWHRWLHQPLNISAQNQIFTVARGETLTSVGHRLEREHILQWPKIWRFYGRFFAPEPIKVGEYQLEENLTPIMLLALLQSGKVITYELTLVEGKTFAEFIVQLAQAPKLESLLAGKDLEQQMLLLDLPIDHPEGWFYPDTYQYRAKDTDIQVLRRAYDRMQSILEEEWQGRGEQVPYQSSYDALIMASIVEKETAVPSERPAIAGVFVRRLLKGMRLQTDPTVIYGLGERYQGNITRKHLRQKTPYNTYVIKGLPPTPIAMPGREAIHAALHPAPGETLYFVARGDGRHQFSATLEQHNQAVNQYQRFKRVEGYRSSPTTK